MDLDAVRAQFPLLQRQIGGRRIIYLDAAATTPKPQRVIDSIVDYYSNHCANIHRAAHILSEEASRLYEDARSYLASLINARRDEIIFVRNATEAINTVRHSIAIRNGQNVITTIGEHHSNFLPWLTADDVRQVGLDASGTLNLDEFAEALDSHTAMVAVNHISNVSGIVQPVERVIEMAHGHGARVLIDAAQSASHVELDVKKLECDYLATSAHKMFGPTGIGALYARKQILEEMEPLFVGGGMALNVTNSGFEPEDLPARFEAGTPNIAGAIGFGEAVRFLQDIGLNNISRHDKELSSFLIRSLRELPEIEVYPDPTDHTERIGIVSFRIRGMNQDDVASILSSRFNIMLRSGVHCAEPLIRSFRVDGVLRASTHIYNTDEEIQALIDALKSIIATFSRQ